MSEIEYDDGAADFDAGNTYDADLAPDYEPAEPVDPRTENVTAGERVARTETPSGFDYLANPDVSAAEVTTVLQQADAEPAQPDLDEWEAELEQEWASEEHAEQQQAQLAELQRLQTLAQAADDPEGAWRDLQQASEALQQQRVLDEFRQVQAEAAAPFTQAAQANLEAVQAQQLQATIDEVAEGWRRNGLSEEQVQAAWDAAEQRFAEHVAAGAEPDEKTARFVLDTVGAEHALENHGVRLEENWRGEPTVRPVRWTRERASEDLQRRGGYKDAREVGSVTARFARAGMFNTNKRGAK